MAAHTGHAATIPSAEFHFTSADGLRVACTRWDGRRLVRGVVQIISWANNLRESKSL